MSERTTVSRLAIKGGTPVRTEPFPSWPVFDEREVQAVTEVVQSGLWGELEGTKVKEFERAFADYQGAKHGIAVMNGTAALAIAARALDISPGDEVITSAYTFIATPNAALVAGAVPVFVDVDPETFLIDPAKIEEAITPRTRAIMPVHIGGCPADMDAITAIARRRGLAVIEDACQAWGAEWKGQRVGAIGDIGTFSFQSSKNITAGEGGMLVANDDALAERAWSLHNVGRRPGGEWYEHVRVGWNFRMTEFQAAILLVQLSRLPDHTERRDRNARYLTKQLEGLQGIQPTRVDPRVTRHAWHAFLLRYDSSAFAGMSRDAFIEALRAEGIPCEPGYQPLTQSEAIINGMKVYGASPRRCPITEDICENISLFFKQQMLLGTERDMDSIVEAIAKIQAARKG